MFMWLVYAILGLLTAVIIVLKIRDFMNLWDAVPEESDATVVGLASVLGYADFTRAHDSPTPDRVPDSWHICLKIGELQGVCRQEGGRPMYVVGQKVRVRYFIGKLDGRPHGVRIIS